MGKSIWCPLTWGIRVSITATLYRTRLKIRRVTHTHTNIRMTRPCVTTKITRQPIRAIRAIRCHIYTFIQKPELSVRLHIGGQELKPLFEGGATTSPSFPTQCQNGISCRFKLRSNNQPSEITAITAEPAPKTTRV